MSKSKRILITSHCVLNQNAVVQPLARSAGMMHSAVAWAQREGVGIYQLPCPEFALLGPNRAPMDFDEYNTVEFHQNNQKLLAPVMRKLRLFQESGYQIIGSMHVQGSPSCDPDTGNWISDLLRAAEAEGIEILNFWQLPETETGTFSISDPASTFGDPRERSGCPSDAATTPIVIQYGARIPVRSQHGANL